MISKRYIYTISLIYDSHHKVSSWIIVFQLKTQWSFCQNIKQQYERGKQHSQILSACICSSYSCPPSLHWSCMFPLFWNYYGCKVACGWVRLGNLDLDFEIRISDFPSNAKSENGFHLLEILFLGGFQLQNPNPDFLIFLLLPFDREIRKSKGICKLINCQLWTVVFFLLIMRACVRLLI